MRLKQCRLGFLASETVPFPQLQESQAFGGGIVAKQNLTTVANSWWSLVGPPSARAGQPFWTAARRTARCCRWGIEAGLTVEVLWVYLGRATQWEDLLPAGLDEGLPSFSLSSSPLHGESICKNKRQERIKDCPRLYIGRRQGARPAGRCAQPQ